MCMKERKIEGLKLGDTWQADLLLGLLKAIKLTKEILTPGPAVIIPDKPTSSLFRVNRIGTQPPNLPE